MKTHFLFPVALGTALACATAALAEPPKVPAESIAKKKELLFSDDFEGAARPKEWHRVVDTFVFEAHPAIVWVEGG